MKVTPSQSPAATQQADPSSSTSGSGSDFGPILQAASVSPGAAPAQKQSEASTGGQQRSTTRDSSASGTGAAPKDRAPPKPQPGNARGSTPSEQPPEAQAAAAACAVAAAGAANRVDIAAATQNAPGGRASSEKAGASDPATSVPGAAVSDTSALPGTATNTADSAQATPVEAKTSTSSDTSLAIAAQPSRPESGVPPSDRSKSSDGARSSVQTRDARTTTAREDADADPQAAAGVGTVTAPASAAPAAQDARGAVQALSADIRSAGSATAGGAPSHSDATSNLAVPVDPAGSGATAAAGAFGNATTTYAADGRAAVATPVGQPGFSQEFSERVVVLARGGVQSAQISLEPAGLGPVGVSIQVHGHEATLVFTAQHETTRSALEAALPRLREMFAECGMQLSDASVGGRAQPDRSAPDYSPSSNEPLAGGADPMGTPPAEPARAAAALRLVDTYA